MKRSGQAITILIHRDGAVRSRSYRVPVWVLRVTLVGGALFLGLLVTVLALYVPILGLAGRVPALRSEISRLRAENAQVHRLQEAVDSLESHYGKVRGMLGANVSGEGIPGLDRPMEAPAVVVRGGPPLPVSSPLPVRWPLDASGYVTRGQLGAADDPTHAGTDIAVPTGTAVRAAGNGTIVEAASDAEYGLYVLIRHDESFTTRYAHLSRFLVQAGDTVEIGQVIGLSGNSGRSSAPHLHFEIRRRGQSIDPLTQATEGR